MLWYGHKTCSLYVSGDWEKKCNRAVSLNVDFIAMDCEDGVTANRKVCHSNCTASTLLFFLCQTLTSSIVLLKELIVTQLVKKFPAFLKSKSKGKGKVVLVLN
jgi:hypothetical protein